MPKAGEEYQELVALVAKALDSDAEVKTGQWVEGPDGDREVDVEVRGTLDGVPHFILIECKDWRRPVDIQEVDKLDSKRRDLSADTAIIYSNSGFSAKAIRKASRVGIEAVSALAWGDKRVKLVCHREFYAKRLSVDNLQLIIFPNEETDRNIPKHWDHTMLYFDGLPVANWLHDLTLDLIQEHEGKHKMEATFAFKRETLFELNGRPVVLRGMCVIIECSQKWLSQTVQEDVSLGLYDHIKQRITVPNQQMWSVGVFDLYAEGWTEVSEEPESLSEELEPGTFRLQLTLLKPVPKLEDKATPAIDDFVSEKSIQVS